ncbi:hypothetical protein HDV06_005169 [Boothiomyces sp. JEL0866]|nr:hypothetical protein HDV06_005169 [Boothiomyces sp. JEL0866]
MTFNSTDIYNEFKQFDSYYSSFEYLGCSSSIKEQRLLIQELFDVPSEILDLINNEFIQRLSKLCSILNEFGNCFVSISDEIKITSLVVKLPFGKVNQHVMELEDYYLCLKNLDLYEDYFEILGLKFVDCLPKLLNHSLSIEKKINYSFLQFKKEKTEFAKEMVVFAKFISLLFKDNQPPHCFLAVLNQGIKKYVNESNSSELEINLLQYGLLLEPFIFEKENILLSKARTILNSKSKNTVPIQKEWSKKQEKEQVEYHISEKLQEILELLEQCDHQTCQTILDMTRIYTNDDMISYNDMHHLYKYCALKGYLDQSNLFIKKQKEILVNDYKSTLLMQDKIIEKAENYKLKIKEKKDYYLIKQELKKIELMSGLFDCVQKYCKSWDLLTVAIQLLNKMDTDGFNKLVYG